MTYDIDAGRDDSVIFFDVHKSSLRQFLPPFLRFFSCWSGPSSAICAALTPYFSSTSQSQVGIHQSWGPSTWGVSEPAETTMQSALAKGAFVANHCAIGLIKQMAAPYLASPQWFERVKAFKGSLPRLQRPGPRRRYRRNDATMILV